MLTCLVLHILTTKNTFTSPLKISRQNLKNTKTTRNTSPYHSNFCDMIWWSFRLLVLIDIVELFYVDMSNILRHDGHKYVNMLGLWSWQWDQQSIFSYVLADIVCKISSYEIDIQLCIQLIILRIKEYRALRSLFSSTFNTIYTLNDELWDRHSASTFSSAFENIHIEHQAMRSTFSYSIPYTLWISSYGFDIQLCIRKHSIWISNSGINIQFFIQNHTHF